MKICANVPGFSFYYANKGMLDFFKTDENAHHAEEMVTASKKLGLDATLLNKQEVEQMEPTLNMDIKGAVYFKDDSHMYPNKLMKDMIAYLRNNGVTIKTGEEVKTFIKEGNNIKGSPDKCYLNILANTLCWQPAHGVAK